MNWDYIKTTVIFLLFHFFSFTQSNLDDYKYVTVPDRFDFLKTADQYQLNSLTEFLLTKNGFIVLGNLDYYPSDLTENRCLMLDLNIKKIKSFLKTKLELQFKNCKNEIVFTSDVGVSNEKDFKKAFHEALRESFISITNANYNFSKKSFASNLKTKKLMPDESLENDTSLIKTKIDNKNYKVIVVPTNYGYDVVGGNKNILLSLYQTTCDNLYIIDKLPGTAYKRGNRWVREYIKDKKTIIESLFNGF